MTRATWLTTGSTTARRSGQAWLAVQGGTGVAQRLRVLDALRRRKLTAQAMAQRDDICHLTLSACQANPQHAINQ
jgi:NAD(P)H-flavin reductase